jgi:hypothetical protein
MTASICLKKKQDLYYQWYRKFLAFFASDCKVPFLLEPKSLLHCSQNPPLDPFLTQFILVNVISTNLSDIHFSIILQYTPGSPKWTFPFEFSNYHSVCFCFLPHLCYTFYWSYISWFNHHNNFKVKSMVCETSSRVIFFTVHLLYIY